MKNSCVTKKIAARGIHIHIAAHTCARGTKKGAQIFKMKRQIFLSSTQPHNALMFCAHCQKSSHIGTESPNEFQWQRFRNHFGFFFFCSIIYFLMNYFFLCKENVVKVSSAFTIASASARKIVCDVVFFLSLVQLRFAVEKRMFNVHSVLSCLINHVECVLLCTSIVDHNLIR